jgi:dTDP-4-dehydrorhamnose reductase
VQFTIKRLKKIAIIGANGMLGSDLVTYLSKYFAVTSISKENYTTHIQKGFDIVINANGNSKRFWANQHIVDDFNLSTYSVYKSIFDFPAKLYIYISSSDVYKDHSSTHTTKEDQNIDSSSLSPYGFHKYLSELIVKKNCKRYLIFRCSMMLGKTLRKGPIYDILQKNPLFITKESTLQMITTEEIANCIQSLITKEIYQETVNMGGKGTVSFTKIENFVSLPVTYSKNAEKQKYEMSTSKLQSFYPLKTSTAYLQEFLNSLQSQ